jgi:hypothetical protein
MSGAITPLPNTPSWRTAQLEHRHTFAFIFCWGDEKIKLTVLRCINVYVYPLLLVPILIHFALPHSTGNVLYEQW